jgi:hypothetical protein
MLGPAETTNAPTTTVDWRAAMFLPNEEGEGSVESGLITKESPPIIPNPAQGYW